MVTGSAYPFYNVSFFKPVLIVHIFIVTLIIILSGVAQNAAPQSSNPNDMVQLIASDGSIRLLKATADDDGDGIDNALEINGFTYSALDGLQPWDGDTTKTYYITDPLRWSTDGDPYSDFMEVSGINMPASISYPENHPLVAARPVISIKMADYDVIPLETISDSRGGEESSSFTNEVSNTDEVSASVTVEATLNPFKLVGGSATASYSHTWTTTESSTSSFGTNWNNTRTTNPDQAARLKLRIYMENKGGATALNVRPTINLKLGKKTIATFIPSQTANVLSPPGTADNRFPKNGTIVVEEDENANYLIITLDELKAIQSGTPLSLEVIQVDAKVVRWNSSTQSWNSDIDWSGFESEINPVSVEVLAELGDGENYRYEVFAGTPYWDPQYTLGDIVSLIFEKKTVGQVTYIEDRPYPEAWYFSSPSQAVINQWNSQGQPTDMLSLRMSRNTKIVMMSPGSNPNPRVRLATYSGDYRNVLVSAVPNNFPIQSVTAKISINGQMQTITLQQGANSFYSSPAPLAGIPDGPGTVTVTNARGDVTTTTIVIPAIYKNAAEVKAYSSFLPNPGNDYWIYQNGDPDKPMLLYCLFFDPQTQQELSVPREYLSLQSSAPYASFSDLLAYEEHYRFYFDKARINPNTLKLALNDRIFTREEVLVGQGTVPSWIGDYAELGRLVWTYPELDSGLAKIDLRGTPFHFALNTELTNHRNASHKIDKTRKILETRRSNLSEFSYEYYNFEGAQDDSLQLIMNFEAVPAGQGLDKTTKAVHINATGDDGYINMGDAQTLRVSNSLTMEAWIYPTGPGLSDPWGGNIINKEGEYEIIRSRDGAIRWAFKNTSPGWVWQNSYFHVPEEQWLHLAIVYDYDQNEVRCYFNGKHFRTQPANGPIGDFHTNLNDFRIGGRQGVSAEKFQGIIDEVRIWNRARTASQIKATWNDTLHTAYYSTSDSGLIGYWRMDDVEDRGDGIFVVKDYSINGNDGILNGDVILTGLPTRIADRVAALPVEFVLEQNYPNPFNPQTTIRYHLPAAAEIDITVYNLMGQRVRQLFRGTQAAGSYHLNWDGNNESGQTVAGGMYFYRLTVNTRAVQVRKMLLMR